MTKAAMTELHATDCHPYDLLATVYKAAGDSLRLEILKLLGGDTYGVLELTHIFAVKQSAMSHHLKVLATAGLVESQREGNSIFYRRPLVTQNDPLTPSRQQIYQSLDPLPISLDIQQGIEQIRHQRTEQSQAFFAKNIHQFKAQQELIARFSLYAEPMKALIAEKMSATRNQALEIGPGEGGFLIALSELFDRVIAVDNSPAMLKRARQTAHEEALQQIEFIEGSTEQLIPNQKYSFDAIVMNMVLHHVPCPDLLIRDCEQLLRPGGMLFISELNEHQQSWARESCGDVWLGFKGEQLSQWANKAGLRNGENIFIGVRNGFQVQLRQFIKPGQQ